MKNRTIMFFYLYTMSLVTHQSRKIILCLSLVGFRPQKSWRIVLDLFGLHA